MSIFDFMVNKQSSKKQSIDITNKKSENNRVLVEITKIISGNHTELVDEVIECISDFEQYKEENEMIFECIDIDKVLTDDVLWIAMACILKEYNYITQISWQAGTGAFLDAIYKNRHIKNYNLPIDISMLEDASQVTHIAIQIEREWNGFLFANLSTDSENYFLFPCKKEHFDELNILSSSINKKIKIMKDL